MNAVIYVDVYVKTGVNVSQCIVPTVTQSHTGLHVVCEPNVVQLSGTPAISKYQNVNESLNSKFDLAN